MLTTITGRDVRAGTDQPLRELGLVPWHDPEQPPGVLVYTPVARGNPFQAMLYSSLAGANLVTVPSLGLEEAERSLRALPAAAGRLLHLHWLNVVMARAADRKEATARLDRAVATLHRVKDDGVRLLWTVHNVLPHDTGFEDLEVELRRQVVALSDAVHVMSPRTVELTAPWFELPAEKLVEVQHPGYQGAYPDWVSREQARLQLGLPEGAHVLLLMGAIKPYKGLTELVDAVDELARRRPGDVALVVAGAPDTAPETVAFLERALAHPAIHLLPAKVPVEDVQLLFRAADAAVLPYRRSLNSGSLVLALTFGLPVVVPSQSGSLSLVDEDCSVVYDADDPAGLQAALAESFRLATPTARQAATAAAGRIHPGVIGRRFAAAVHDVLSRPPEPA